MRKIYSYFMMISLFGMMSTSAFGSSDSMISLNDRLRSLQTRMLSFNQNTIAKAKEVAETTVEAPLAADFAVYDSVMIIDEDLLDRVELVELDSELGADLTVLFHDSEFFEERRLEESLGQSAAEGEMGVEPVVGANSKYAEIRAHRQARYEDLKKRFLLACSK